MKGLVSPVPILVILLLAVSCRSSRETFDPRDISYIYNPALSRLNPRTDIFHESEESSILSLKVYPEQLLVNRANPEGVLKGMMEVQYNLYDIDLGGMIADSGRYRFDVPVREPRQQQDMAFMTQISLEAPRGSHYNLELIIKDINAKRSVQLYLPFEKINEFSRYHFRVYDQSQQELLFSPTIRENQFFHLRAPNIPLDSLFVKVLPPVEKLPEAPSMQVPTPGVNTLPQDTLAVPYIDTSTFMFPREGIYHISPERNTDQGITFFNFGPYYPGVRTPEAMLESLAYLLTEEEMAEMKRSDNLKLALDNWWLERTGNIERSRELIRVYYNRVLFANYYFASHREGWLTDRGMIYIIYGPPQKLHKTADSETWGYEKKIEENKWGYTERTKDDYLYFRFIRRDNPFTQNDYILSRGETVTTYWEVAVQSWRNGVIFMLDNPIQGSYD